MSVFDWIPRTWITKNITSNVIGTAHPLYRSHSPGAVVSPMISVGLHGEKEFRIVNSVIGQSAEGNPAS